LSIDSIRFSNFRNYQQLKLENLGGLTVFVGKNGVGKTNILEGIQLLTSAQTFRHAVTEQMVLQGKEHGLIGVHAVGDSRDLSIELSIEKGKRRYTLNGKGKNASEIRGIIPSVIFTPDDLEIAKKSSSIRRECLDDLGSQLSKSYFTVRQDYEKVIRYKNRLLKEEATQSYIESVNDTLVTCGTQLFCYRRSLFEKIVPLITDHYAEISLDTEQFSALYQPSWNHLDNSNDHIDIAKPEKDEVRTLLEKALEKHGGEEVTRKRSLVGPHNDKITFFLAGKDSASFASQGQQRSIVLALKIAEVKLTQQMLGIDPVLLLDDVMSELDESRRDTLVNFVQEDMQTFITATDLSYFNNELMSRARVITLPLN